MGCDYGLPYVPQLISCEVPMAGDGGAGAVVDHDGALAGMAFYCNPDTALLSISTVVMCVEMWLGFSHVARPMHGLDERTVEQLDVSVQVEIAVGPCVGGGFVVDVVSHGDSAEICGCFDRWPARDDSASAGRLSPLLVWVLLKDASRSSTVDINFDVYDVMKKSKRSITLAVPFCDS
ncbi:hypothetical protein BS78_02G016600 [Paspalum vaginatum]|nr:hypothetical protein BS78_02G016600 [Paspalum vaginatum]